MKNERPVDTMKKITCSNAIKVETEIVPFSKDFKIELLSMSGTFEIDYDLQIEALIYFKVKVTKGNQYAIFERDESFENISPDKVYSTTIDYMERVEDSTNSEKEFQEFYDGNMQSSLIQFKFSADQ